MDTTNNGTNDTQMDQIDGYTVPIDPREAPVAPVFNDNRPARLRQYDDFHTQEFEAMVDRAQRGEDLIDEVLPYPAPPVDPMELLQCDSCQ